MQVLARFVCLGGLDALHTTRAPVKGTRHGSLAAPVAVQVLATGHPTGAHERVMIRVFSGNDIHRELCVCAPDAV